MARQTKVFLVHDLADKRFIQGKVMVPDSVTVKDIVDFVNELEDRLFGLLIEDKEESVDV